MMEQQQAGSNDSWLRRIGWMVAIWVLSVTALGVVAMGIRAILH